MRACAWPTCTSWPSRTRKPARSSRTRRSTPTFTLQDAGGPRINERPDATGLYSDGRFIDYSVNQDLWGKPASTTRSSRTSCTSISLSEDGERAYVSGTTSGFYVLNTESIASHTDADLASGKAGCNLRTTIVATETGIDASKLPQLANDCVHMIVNDDAGPEGVSRLERASRSETAGAIWRWRTDHASTCIRRSTQAFRPALTAP